MLGQCHTFCLDVVEAWEDRWGPGVERRIQQLLGRDEPRRHAFYGKENSHGIGKMVEQKVGLIEY